MNTELNTVSGEIGQVRVLELNGLEFEVQIMDKMLKWGVQVHYQVRPVSGDGLVWVRKEQLR